MNWTERLAKVWNLGNAKLQTRNRKLRFEIAVCLMLKVSNQMVWLTTCFWRERLSSFEFVFFFFSFITLKGRLPVKWTAYEALLYGVYTTQSDVWVVNIIWYLKLSCSFFVNYKCSHLPFLSICSWSYGILLYIIQSLLFFNKWIDKWNIPTSFYRWDSISRYKTSSNRRTTSKRIQNAETKTRWWETVSKGSVYCII